MNLKEEQMAHQLNPAWMTFKKAINDNPEEIAKAIESVNIRKYQPIATPEKHGWVIDFTGRIILEEAK